MSVDSDLSAALPEPPPPRPARREAAIDAALRRFDGGVEPLSPPRAARPARIGRTQIAAFAAVALVAVAALPVWLSGDRPIPAAEQAAPGPAAAEAPALAEAEGAALEQSRFEPPPPAVPAERGDEAVAQRAADKAAPAGAQPAAEPPAPPSAIATESLKQFADAAPAPAPPVAAKESRPQAGAAASRGYAAEDDSQIVVTGARVAASPRERRLAARQAGPGDWNACTVNDPRRDLAACRRLINPAASGPAGRAAARLADGLQAAWRGDDDDAIAAFDQAIALAPRQSLAYLNRGLAYRGQGDLDRALADLDEAVRAAPRDARGYYHRAQLLRQQGDTRRAARDEERAVALNPRYQDVVE